MQLWGQVPSFNPLQILDRIILDIGSDAGAGLFSLLTVRARARHVDCWELSIQSC
jgi:tRNA G37 N-methylase Trm5